MGDPGGDDQRQSGDGAPVKEALEGARDAFTAAGIDSPRLDAEVLLASATGLSREQLAADPDAPIPGGAARRFSQMVRRRVRREPVAYIVGRKAFRGIELDVDRRVLVPRPETELLVEIAVELSPATVLDVGTGSGAVALAAADEIPGVQVTATDTSAGALEIARGNAIRLGLDDRITFATGTLPARGSFELLLANLPYVGESEWGDLEPEIREFEPRLALVPGPTGMEAIESLMMRLAAVDDLAGTVALEVGAGQAEATSELMRGAGFERIEARPDLAGIDRVVIGRRPDAPG
ncbi:MAG: protein-(glutamine-N5) methyltransferase, release factor-specific [Solirubrobacterales bacterium]|jgi:release factor glutamine methyltransferase|nr:protein-(glutamine-N5) methyltransferase, release factor-specific [Solirubrobacterales bacterium]